MLGNILAMPTDTKQNRIKCADRECSQKFKISLNRLTSVLRLQSLGLAFNSIWILDGVFVEAVPFDSQKTLICITLSLGGGKGEKFYDHW